MSVNEKAYEQIIADLSSRGVTLVAVSKTKSIDEIMELYDLGQKDFGENYVQELLQKQAQLPRDIRWHFIGHLQSNKIKQIASFVHLIQGVDSGELAQKINKQALATNRVIDCLLQVHIAQEETKFGLNEKELRELMNSNRVALTNVRIRGLMAMASFSDDLNKIRAEFKYLKTLFDEFRTVPEFNILSMGMSADYPVALEEGSTMVRIGSLIFGPRN
jgi:PLP dependent protein